MNMDLKRMLTLSSQIKIEYLVGKCILIIGLLVIMLFSVTPGVPSPANEMDPIYIVYIPWTATTDGWTTPFVIANKGNSNARVNISYYNASDGSNVSNFSLDIERNSSRYVFREWNASNTNGSAILVSNQSVTVMVAMFNNNIYGAYEVEPSGFSDTSKTIYLPWTANARGWNTPVVIMNRGSADATVNITYYNIGGSVAGNHSVTIPRNASTFALRDNCGECEGPASITSDQPISVMVEIFRGSENTDTFSSYTSAQTAKKIYVPWTATTQGWRTQMKIANSGNASATVNIDYYDTATDTKVGNDSVNIPPNGVATMFRDKTSTSANSTDGLAILNSNQPISVVVMQFSNNDSLFGAYTPAVNANNSLTIPWTATTQGWTSPYVIANTGNANATVKIDYYNTENGSIVGNISMTIPTNSSKFAFREWNTTSNTDGSAVVSSDQPVTAVVYFFNDKLLAASTPIG